MIIEQAKRLNIVSEYYFSKKLAEIRKMISEGKPVINLGIGSPDMPPSHNTVNALKKSADNPKNHGYQSYTGIPGLRKSFAGWYKEYYSVNLNPDDEILPLIGSKEGILYISLAFLNPGDEVLIPNPGYPTYSSVSNLVGAKIRYYDLKEENNWEPDFKNLEKEDLSKVKIMWVNYPHMPTGKNGTKELFEKIIRFSKKHKILICNDNPYSFILNDKPMSILSVEGAKDVAVELNSLSKSHNMPGWRIGVLCGQNDYIQTVLKVNSNVHSGMFLPMQEAAIEALQNPPSWYKKINNEYKKRRELVYQIFDQIECSYDKNQAGLFIWAKIPSKYESAEVLSEKILQKANIFITPGFIFGANGKNYLRIALCSDFETLKEVIKRLKNTIL
ncbi:MAG: aminotransferase class I/II-fold pyridoxal phosphate-dependent enzyme [Bacteroidales bacterium]|nr:aminotransferase class I/II-fold pyridoxal phosphate-dependent enzyme [Bacteroidales bacterium]